MNDGLFTKSRQLYISCSGLYFKRVKCNIPFSISYLYYTKKRVIAGERHYRSERYLTDFINPENSFVSINGEDWQVEFFDNLKKYAEES